MDASVQQTMAAFEGLNSQDQRAVAREIAAQIGNPSDKTTDNIWYIVVGGLVGIAVAALIAVVVLLLDGKSATAAASFGSLALGGLVGIVAPSPVQSGGS